MTPWLCTIPFFSVPLGLTVQLPTQDHDEAQRIVREAWPGARVDGRWIETMEKKT